MIEKQEADPVYTQILEKFLHHIYLKGISLNLLRGHESRLPFCKIHMQHVSFSLDHSSPTNSFPLSSKTGRNRSSIFILWKLGFSVLVCLPVDLEWPVKYYIVHCKEFKG